MIKRKIHVPSAKAWSGRGSPPGGGTPAKSPLKTILTIGLILAMILSWGLVIYLLIWGRDVSGRGEAPANSFTRELNEYDLYNAPGRAMEGENPVQIERRLASLQKKVKSAEEQLSVLKRRRALAFADRRFIADYRKAAREAAEAFAYSAPLAAVAAEAVVFESGLLSGDELALLKSYASRVSQNRFSSLELSIRILAGELENPARAAEIPGLLNLLSLDFQLPPEARKNLAIDEFLLRTYMNDIPGASLGINSLLAATGSAKHDTELLRMGAEFFYDHRNPLKAAELYLRLADSSAPLGEGDLVRAADALVLAGEIPGARNIWLALASDEGNNSGPSAGNPPPRWTEGRPRSEGSPAEVPLRIRSRSLYNLASSSTDRAEEASLLERIFSLQSRNTQSQRGQDDSTELFSVIRYTRLLDTERSIAVLEEDGMKQNPLLDLELLRRRLDTWPPNRAAAEVWRLISRNPEEETIHEWAAWYFSFQKLYDENTRLLKEAARKGMSGSWLDLHRGLALIREGKTSEGEKVLKETLRFQEGGGSVDWRIPANLGRIQESHRATSSALEYYQTAAALIADRGFIGRKSAEKTAAAQVQMRLSRCLEALGRTSESRRALEYAQELDPDNLNIRRELRRLGN